MKTRIKQLWNKLTGKTSSCEEQEPEHLGTFIMPSESGYTFEYYKSEKNKKWYFRLKASNNKTVSSSRQAYSNKQDCINMIEGIRMNSYGAKVKLVSKL